MGRVHGDLSASLPPAVACRVPLLTFTPVTMALLVGSYTLTTSDNFDEFMKALGVGLMMRKMGATVTPTLTVKEADGQYTVTTSSTFKSSEITFRLGEPVKETTMDGREAMSTFTLEGNTLTQKQEASKGASSTYIRIFKEKELETICECNGVKATRIYKRN